MQIQIRTHTTLGALAALTTAALLSCANQIDRDIMFAPSIKEMGHLIPKPSQQANIFNGSYTNKESRHGYILSNGKIRPNIEIKRKDYSDGTWDESSLVRSAENNNVDGLMELIVSGDICKVTLQLSNGGETVFYVRIDIDNSKTKAFSKSSATPLLTVNTMKNSRGVTYMQKSNRNPKIDFDFFHGEEGKKVQVGIGKIADGILYEGNEFGEIAAKRKRQYDLSSSDEKSRLDQLTRLESAPPILASRATLQENEKSWAEFFADALVVESGKWLQQIEQDNARNEARGRAINKALRNHSNPTTSSSTVDHYTGGSEKAKPLTFTGIALDSYRDKDTGILTPEAQRQHDEDLAAAYVKMGLPADYGSRPRKPGHSKVKQE